MEGKYVLALDVGTTTVRCYVLDQSTAVIGKACQEVSFIVSMYCIKLFTIFS
jgi:glycerol kinase